MKKSVPKDVLLSMLEDLEASKKALQSEKDWADSLIRFAPNIVIGLGEKSRIILFNKFAEKLTGYKAKEVLGKRWIDVFIPKGMRKVMYGVWDKIVEKKLIEHHYENPILTKDGSEKMISWNNTVLKEEGRFKMVLSMGVDITEHKQAEMLLRESEDRYRTFVQKFQGIAYRSTLDSVPIFFQGAVKKITGYTEKEFKAGKPRWDQVIHPDDFSSIKTSWKNLAEIPDYSDKREYRIIRKDGAVRWVFDLVQNVCDDSGKPVFVQGALHDITASKEAEAALKKANKELSRVNEVQKHLIRDVSHSLKTPTAMLSMASDALMEEIDSGGYDSDRVRSLAKIISSSSAESMDMIDNIVEMGHLESGIKPVRRRRFSVCDAVRSAIDLFRPLVDGENVRLVFKKRCGDCAVLGDRSAFMHVIVNLLDNSLKFTEKGTIEICVRDRLDSVRVSVKDTGRGMTEKELENVFTKFYKADPGMRGIGMGLSLAKTFVEVHGGKIRAESEGRGKGSAFIFTIPKKGK